MEAQIDNSLKERMQDLFPCGKIVSISGNIGTYRLNGIRDGGNYGYCFFDSTYMAKESSKGKSWDKESGEIAFIMNSRCYTIVAPCFDYALPFSEGWGAVCKEGKWSYVNSEGKLLCDFVLDAAYPFKDGKAKVRYRDKEFQIQNNGRGLFENVRDKAKEETLELASLTIDQLISERQYEKSISLGNSWLKSFLPSKEYSDLPNIELLPAIRILFALQTAQNSLMTSTRLGSDTFNYYKALPVRKAFSYSVKSLSLLSVPKSLISSFPGIDKEEFSSLIDHQNYKQAVILLENIVEKDNSCLKNANFIYLYIVTLSLAGDFETKNKLVLALSEVDLEKSNLSTLDKAVCLAELKQYKKAKAVLSRIISGTQKDKFIQGLCWHHLALIAEDIQIKSEAISYYKNAVSCFEQSDKRENLLDALTDLICLETNQNNDYNGLLKQYLKEEVDYNVESFSTLDSYHLNKIWGRSQYRISRIISHIVTTPGVSDKPIREYGYNLTIMQKNMLEYEQMRWQQIAYQSDNFETKSMMAEYDSLRSLNRGIDIFDLKNDSAYLKAEPLYKLEREIKKRVSANVQNQDLLMDFSSSNLLPLDVVGIEFFEYKNRSNIDCIGAWVMTHDEPTPKFVEIMKQDDCSSYLTEYRYKKDNTHIARLFSSDFASRIWRKIPDIGENHKVIFSPLGAMSEAGIEYIPINEKSLIETHEVHRVRSTYRYNHIEDEDDSHQTVLLFGGLDYGLAFESQERGAIETGYLEYSLTEVEDIASTLEQTFLVKKYIEKDGTKETFIHQASSSPRIIHFATHGWQKEHPFNFESWRYQDRFNYYQQNTDIEDEDWLLYTSGLFMSENDVFTDSLQNILFASDIVKLRLDSTALVVLSACNTIAGSSANGYSCTLGLNYAFQQAGVKSIVSSMWNVNDKTTFEFMNDFYKEIISTKNVHRAFYNAVKNMKNKYPNHPEVWASFIYLENKN